MTDEPEKNPDHHDEDDQEHPHGSDRKHAADGRSTEAQHQHQHMCQPQEQLPKEQVSEPKASQI